MKKISMMQAAGEAGQCIVGFVVAAMLFGLLAGAMFYLFAALAVVAPVLILLNAYADGMIFQERGGDEDDLENDSKTALADSNADSDSGDSKNDDSDSATMSADSERPSSEEKP